MCKIDYLGTGVCASGLERRYVSFYPEGRLDLYAALVEGRVPVTPAVLEIADSCDECGICEMQCYFVTGLRPGSVLCRLKQFVAEFRASGGAVQPNPEDEVLRELRAIVGEPWASNDPAIRLTYGQDPNPVPPKIPGYVVLPGSAEEVARLLSFLNGRGIPWAARGNGTNILGFALSEGVVIDLNRMQEMVFNEANWSVRIGPGVSAFELQRAAKERGFRVNVAEPAALVISAIMCSGILSLFGTSYGSCADSLIDAQFIDPTGQPFSMNQKQGPNLFAFDPRDQQSPGICVGAEVKLHPVLEDEEGVLVPFTTFAEGIEFARECARRRIGIAVGVLGLEYVASFMAPTQELARDFKEILGKRLGMECLVLVLGDCFAIGSVRIMGYPLIDQRLFRILNLGLANLGSAPWLDLLTEMQQEEPFAYLKAEGFTDLAETALGSSPKELSRSVEPDLQHRHEQLYGRPELTDLVWLNTFRITSSRIGREKHFSPVLLYLPLEPALIGEFCADLQRIGREAGIKNEIGFITPVDGGKRCILEFDYYADQCDTEEITRLKRALQQAGALIEEYSERTGTLRWIRYLLYQGFCRQENMLYGPVPKG
jgi:hypothetical protein